MLAAAMPLALALENGAKDPDSDRNTDRELHAAVMIAYLAGALGVARDVLRERQGQPTAPQERGGGA